MKIKKPSQQSLINKLALLGRFACLLALLLATPSFAHEEKTALTDIFYNERTGNLEIAHRFSVHDAEHALKKATDSRADLARSSQAQAEFSKYVAKRFGLFFKDRKKLKLTLVGQELERGYLWVYQETRIPKPVGASFLIENSILQDEVQGQVNTVNVRYRSKVSTFEFKAGTGKQRYEGPVDVEGKKAGPVGGNGLDPTGLGHRPYPIE